VVVIVVIKVVGGGVKVYGGDVIGVVGVGIGGGGAVVVVSDSVFVVIVPDVVN
jgi:hypothetical protein